MRLHATGRDLIITEKERLISGSINMYTCEFTFDSSWDGYMVTAVFSTANKVVNGAIVDGKCDIPPEVLRPNARLRIGVFGNDGVRTRPTTYSEWLPVEQGADTNGRSGRPPEPSVYEQWVNSLAEMYDDWNEQDQERAEELAAASTAAISAKESETAAKSSENNAKGAENNATAAANAAKEAARRAQLIADPEALIANKMDIVEQAEAGNVPVLTEDGKLEDSGRTVQQLGQVTVVAYGVDTYETLLEEWKRGQTLVCVNGKTVALMFNYKENAYFSFKYSGTTGVNTYFCQPSGWSSKYEKFAVTPTDIGAVKNTGDTMTGTLSINKSSYPTYRLFELDTGFSSNLEQHDGVFSVHTGISGQKNYRSLQLYHDSKRRDVEKSLCLKDVDSDGEQKFYSILHEGNLDTFNIARAPKGSYVGTGAVTKQTHNVGYGNAVLIWTEIGSSYNQTSALVTPAGLIGFQNTTGGGSVGAYATNSATFKDGVLKISSRLSYLNSSGVTYYYQVI